MSTSHKNVVLLMTDQQRWDTIAALGNSQIQTPNLDRLCAMGVAFTHGFTPSPSCGPFTGVSSRDAGGPCRSTFRPPPRNRHFTESLLEAGCHTGGFGKFHFRPERAPYGFQPYRGQEEYGPDGRRMDDDYAMYLKANDLEHPPHLITPHIRRQPHT